MLLRHKCEICITFEAYEAVLGDLLSELIKYGITGVSFKSGVSVGMVYFYYADGFDIDSVVGYIRSNFSDGVLEVNISVAGQENIYEVYIPDSAIDDTGSVYQFDEDYYNNRIDCIVHRILRWRGVVLDIQDEEGYYNSNIGGITHMRNKVVSFYCTNKVDTDWIVSYIKTKLKQETVLIVKNEGAEIC